ncbi:MAG: ATP-binding protein [Proteobacteria bacterium]|nr:ATP-binding protein [Pseudomonadota bacterium]
MKFDPNIDFNIVQSILDSLPMEVYVLDRGRKIQWKNERIAIWSQEEGIFQSGKTSCYREIFKRRVPCSNCPALRTLKSGRLEHTEIKSKHKGKSRHYLITTAPLRKGRVEDETLIIETVQDITDQKKTEEALRSLNDFNKAIIDNAPVAIFTIDRDGKFMSVNPALAALSGLGAEAEEKLLRFNWLQNTYTVRCGLAEHIKKGLNGEPFELQDFPFTTYRGDQGQYIHFRGVPLKSKNGKVEGLLCIIEDNTEKVKAKIQSIQDVKTSVIGRLMTGVAHELNNPLATIAANSELACELFQGFKGGNAKEDEMTELREYLDVIQEQAFRCKNIIKDMIDLTKKKDFEVQEIDLNVCLNDLLKQINFKKLNIRLYKDIAPCILHVKGDLNAVKQSFMNIFQNAVDAVGRRDGGVIRVKAYPIDNTVKVEIEDNGVGIHDDLIDKIFEPFFSTKDAGKGVGLGLTLCYEFLNRMGGNIEVESKLGRGSFFKVTLPGYFIHRGEK